MYKNVLDKKINMLQLKDTEDTKTLLSIGLMLVFKC
jgi:hypothetical protein